MHSPNASTNRDWPDSRDCWRRPVRSSGMTASLQCTLRNLTCQTATLSVYSHCWTGLASRAGCNEALRPAVCCMLRACPFRGLEAWTAAATD